MTKTYKVPVSFLDSDIKKKIVNAGVDAYQAIHFIFKLQLKKYSIKCVGNTAVKHEYVFTSAELRKEIGLRKGLNKLKKLGIIENFKINKKYETFQFEIEGDFYFDYLNELLCESDP